MTITESDNSREEMCTVVFKELNFFREAMGKLMPKLKAAKVKQKTLEKLDSSIKLIIKIVDIYLRNDLEYRKSENPETFGVYMNNTEDAIKAFFKAYIIENDLQTRLKSGFQWNVIKGTQQRREYRNYRNDSIDNLMLLMYDSLAEKRGLLIQDRSIDYAYPSVIRAVKYIKNLQHHEIVNIPTDYRTDVEAYGNIFTLCSILILVFHAYVEMLEVWLQTIDNL